MKLSLDKLRIECHISGNIAFEADRWEISEERADAYSAWHTRCIAEPHIMAPFPDTSHYKDDDPPLQISSNIVLKSATRTQTVLHEILSHGDRVLSPADRRELHLRV